MIQLMSARAVVILEDGQIEGFCNVKIAPISEEILLDLDDVVFLTGFDSLQESEIDAALAPLACVG